jgi:hypothetical protein
MIVQPDFLTHWKTRKLVNLMETPEAPLFVIRLWALCQTSRQDTIPANAETIKAICEYSGSATRLYKALIECGFLDKKHNGYHTIHGWAEINARLLHNWHVGGKGGRPKGSEKETLGKPLGYDGNGKPLGYPQGTDRSDRLDRSDRTDRLDRKEQMEQPSGDAESVFLNHVSVSGWSVVEACRFACTGSPKGRDPNKTIPELASRIPEDVLLKLCAEIYAGRQSGKINEPGAYLTTRLKQLVTGWRP